MHRSEFLNEKLRTDIRNQAQRLVFPHTLLFLCCSRFPRANYIRIERSQNSATDGYHKLQQDSLLKSASGVSPSATRTTKCSGNYHVRQYKRQTISLVKSRSQLNKKKFNNHSSLFWYVYMQMCYETNGSCDLCSYDAI